MCGPIAEGLGKRTFYIELPVWDEVSKGVRRLGHWTRDCAELGMPLGHGWRRALCRYRRR